MRETTVSVPDIGDFDQVDVVEVLVKPGDEVQPEQPLITLESEKASLEVPAPQAGVVKEVLVKVGDKVSQGSAILTLQASTDAADEAQPQADPNTKTHAEAPAPQAKTAQPAATQSTAERQDGRQRPPPGRVAPAATQSAPHGGTTSAATEQPAGKRVVVIGAGPGGYTAAFRAADLGLEVTLIERYESLGGVCLNVGCIPSKALLHAARVITETQEMAAHGLKFGTPQIDLAALRAWKDNVVGRLTGGLVQLARQRKVKVIRGVAQFESPKRLRIEGGGQSQSLDFDQAILAAGSRTTKLPFLPEDERIMYSTQALEVPEIPGRLLVLGGGIIGMEMATMYAAFGSRITVVEMTDQLLPGADADLVRPLHKLAGQRFEAIYLNTKVTEVNAGEHLTVKFEGKDAPASAEFDRILVAVGRRPNSDGLQLEQAGIQIGERGLLQVDRQMRTSQPHIFAIGDLVAGPMLAHKASHQAKVAAEAAAGQKSAFDIRALPAIAYCDPEVAWVGLTEREAKAQGIAYGKGSFPWAANGRSLGMGRDEGMTKLLFDKANDRLIGAGVVGPNAGDLIAELALALEMGCVAEDIALTVHAHPTLAETVMMSAEAYAGTLTDLYLKPR